MLTTLLFATATMAAPATIAPVNFVHGYRQGCKLTYEMAFGFVTGLELTMTFDLAVGATNNGKTDVLLEVTDRGAFSISEEEGAIELVLDANGVPYFVDSSEAGLLENTLEVPLDALNSVLANAPVKEVADLLVNTSPRIDTVRRWLAPHTGTIRVKGTAATRS